MKTKITEMLGIEYPVFQGGMAWVSDGALAAAVSGAGGLGIIAAGNMPADLLKSEIQKAKKLTDKPFGVNVMLMSPTVDDVIKTVLEEMPAVVTTGAGNPTKCVKIFKEAGIKVFPVVAGVSHAKLAERAGADGVIAEGTESGGHIGAHATMSLVPQVVKAVSIPVIAAGGIATGEGLSAALCLGAEGVQCGTVFLASDECNISGAYKELIIKANDNSTAVTGRSIGLSVRSLRTKLTKVLEDMEKAGRPALEIEEYTVGSLKKAVRDGNVDEGAFMCGQIAGCVDEIRPVKTIIKDMVTGAENVLRKMQKFTAEN